MENHYEQSSQQKKVTINGKLIETNRSHYDYNAIINTYDQSKESPLNQQVNSKRQTRYGHIIVKDYTEESIQQFNHI